MFTNLEKLYLYRYVFTKGLPADYQINLPDFRQLEDKDIRTYLKQTLEDSASFEAWSETDNSNCNPSEASLSNPGTTPHVESVMWRAPRLGPRPAFISFSARIVSS